VLSGSERVDADVDVTWMGGPAAPLDEAGLRAAYDALDRVACDRLVPRGASWAFVTGGIVQHLRFACSPKAPRRAALVEVRTIARFLAPPDLLVVRGS